MEVINGDVGLMSVGATGFVDAHLFGYLGNQCGDADADGSGDTIDDLLLDLDVGYTVDARLRGLLLPDQDLTLLEGLRHLYLGDLWEDPEGWNVTDPIVTGPDRVGTDRTVTYELATRPCYPYSDDVHLQWTGLISGTGSLTPGSGSLAVSTVPAVTGDFTLEVTTVSDEHLRRIDTSTSMPVTVTGHGGGGDGDGSDGSDGIELANGVTETGLVGGTGAEAFYTIDVPEGATNLTIDLSDGSGDADLYVRFGAPPGTEAYECSSTHSNNNESCSFESPQVGTYHVLVYAYSTYSGVSLVASYTEPAQDVELANGVAESDLAGETGSEVE